MYSRHRWIVPLFVLILFTAAGASRVASASSEEAALAVPQAGGTQSRSESEERAAGTSGSRQVISREETAQGSRERRVVQSPSINGGYDSVLEVEEETIRIDDENSRVIRREFNTDPDGRQRLTQSIEEDRIERADGSSEVVRNVSEPDINGRLQATRQEVETTIQRSPGVFETEVQVFVPGVNQRDFVPSELVQQTERRDEDDRVLEMDQTRYSNPVGGTGWIPVERRQVSYDYDGDRSESATDIYTPDGSGNLSLSDRVVDRTWTDSQGQERTSQEIYARDVPGLPRSSSPRLYRQVDVVTQTRSNGSQETTTETREFQVDRMRVVERVIERSRPDGRGGTTTEREVQRADANGRLRTVRTETGNETEP